MSPRFKALEVAGERPAAEVEPISESAAERFGKLVFSHTVMEKTLPREVYKNVVAAMEGREKIDPKFADQIACAIKEWAMSHGATHYTHWFQPWTGSVAEKHDSFIDWNAPDGVIERFNGSQLVQGEPDASSFPSGGLRATYEARGYTGWDPSSNIFLWKAGGGITLCIPSVFFSWTGDVLDSKIPLQRSDQRINEATLRLLRFTGSTATHVYSTLGWEQEYFIIDRALRNLRPDLLMLGKTVFGAPPAKGQELCDHYFGVVKDRVLAFMEAFEREALELGIPVKTRHNEVAPAQHELACVYEKASVAVDHNIMVMELMRRVAQRHGLACLLHEKPFHDLNGSGKHNNWSLATDTGLNLLDPTDHPEDSLQFLILLTAILDAVHEHAGLFRASIGSAGNDNRLGGHEAPPAILSVYLGEALEDFLQNIEANGSHKSSKCSSKMDLGLPAVPPLTKHSTDRNRTSPFAFTGNKFEFRAVGSAASCALPMTVINLAVAESLDRIMDELEQINVNSEEERAAAALPIIQKVLRKSKGIRFAGDNYSDEWVQEAKKRGLPNLKKCVEAFQTFRTGETEKLFDGVLNKEELASRYEALVETYSLNVNIEVQLMLDMFRSQVLPAATQQQGEYADVLSTLNEAELTSVPQEELLKELTETIGSAITTANSLEEVAKKAAALTGGEQGEAYAKEVLSIAETLRSHVDHLETLVEDRKWPLPKYRELLFLV